MPLNHIADLVLGIYATLGVTWVSVMVVIGLAQLWATRGRW